MPGAEPQKSQKRTFWATWQSAVAIPGILLIGWMIFAPEDARLTSAQVLMAWLAIFTVAAVVALLRVKVQPGTQARALRG